MAAAAPPRARRLPQHVSRWRGASRGTCEPGRPRRSPASRPRSTAMLAAGEMDVANVSSVEYARNSAGVRAAAVAVRRLRRRGRRRCSSSPSCRCERIRTVAATSQSASSVALVRTLLPDVEILGEDADGDAQLLIGDEALHSAFHDPTPHHRPRRAVARSHRPADGVRRLGGPARDRRGAPAARSTGRWPRRWPTRTRTPPTSPATPASATRYPAGYLARYFERLRYRFGARERQGLGRFFALAHANGVLDAVPDAALRRHGGDAPMATVERTAHGLRDPRAAPCRASGSATRTPSPSCSRATWSPWARQPTSCATARPTRTRSRSSSTGTSTTPTSASRTATSAPSTAAPATGARATSCRSRSSSRRSRRRWRSAAPAS